MAKKSKNKKTNAIRIIEQQKIKYKQYIYDTSDGKIDGISAANKIGKNPQCVFKTLVAQGLSKNLYVFCIPVNKELDLKTAAKVAKEKKIMMLPVKDLLEYTGYIRGGCSPIGMKKHYPTFIDKAAQLQENIIVSGGAIGIQIMINTKDLIKIVKGHICEITL